MRFFTQLVRTTFRLQLTYRTAMWAGLATNLFFGILRAAVILALYGDQKVVNGLSIGGAITFVGLTQALIAFTTIFGSSDVMRSVYSGDISTDLLRPMNFYIYWLARDLGGSLVNLLGRGLLFMAAFALLYPIYLPETSQQWLGFAAALVLSWLASFSWRFLVNLAAFWTPDAAGIGRGLFGLAQILSGFFIPLRLLPDWFSRFCAFTPFPAMMNTPVEIYLGTISGNGVIQALAFQAIWVLVLFLLGQLFFSVGVKRLVVQGG